MERVCMLCRANDETLNPCNFFIIAPILIFRLEMESLNVEKKQPTKCHKLLIMRGLVNTHDLDG